MRTEKIFEDSIRNLIKETQSDLLPTMEYIIEHLKSDFPNWEEAPDWANFWSVDGDGCRMWWEHKPEPLKPQDTAWWSKSGRKEVDNNDFYIIGQWDANLLSRPRKTQSSEVLISVG